MPRLDRATFFFALPLLALSAVVQVRFAIMGDKGWLLYAASEWVSGKKLYQDIIEVNPPLIIWLYSIPVWLSRHVTFLPDYAALGLMGLLAATLAVVLCQYIIVLHPAFADNKNGRMAFLLLLFVVVLFIVNPSSFFDREHIMLTLTFPYILRYMPSLCRTEYPRSLSVAIGLLAGLGFAIKPHAVLVFLVLQILYLIRDRSLRMLGSAENLSIYFFGATYLVAILLFARGYITTVLPMVLAVYSGYRQSGTLLHYLPLALFGTALPLVAFRPREATPYRADTYYFMEVSVMYFAYALINNGWEYTYRPFFCVLVFLTAWLWWEYDWLRHRPGLPGQPARRSASGCRWCVLCLSIEGLYALFMVLKLLSGPACGGYPGCSANEPFVTAIEEKGIRSFGVMSGEFTRWPLISRETGADWNTRFNHLWMVPGILNRETTHPGSEQWIVDQVGEAFADDFARRKPDAVFVDTSDEFYTLGRSVDLLFLLKRSSAFTAAWRHYRYDTTLERCKSKVPDSDETVGCRYDVYLRVTPS